MRLYGQTVPSASFTATHWVSKKVEWLFKFLWYITASKMGEIIYRSNVMLLMHMNICAIMYQPITACYTYSIQRNRIGWLPTFPFIISLPSALVSHALVSFKLLHKINIQSAYSCSAVLLQSQWSPLAVSPTLKFLGASLLPPHTHTGCNLSPDQGHKYFTVCRV